MSDPSTRPKGTGPFYVVALAATAVSIDTSWRFFGQRLHITNPLERGAMFAVLEMALVACGYAMAQNVRRPGGKPGPARMFAWALCGLSGYMAVDLAGPVEGAARVILGPVLALIALHLALGIEIRSHRGTSSGTWARIAGELRERFLSRFSLGDDNRKAAERTRDRARDRAARLAIAKKLNVRRLVRSVFAAGATLDPAQRSRLVEQVATLKHVTDLAAIVVESPWANTVPQHVQRLADAAQHSSEAQRAAAETEIEALRDEARRLLAEAQRAAAAQHETALRDIAARHDEAQRKAAQIVDDAAARAAATEARTADLLNAAQHRADEIIATAERAAQRIDEQAKTAADRVLSATRLATNERGAALESRISPTRFLPQRSAARRGSEPSAQRGAVTDTELVEALDAAFRNHVPALRPAAAYLRETFSSCSDKRVAEAVAALRAKRGEAPAAINGHPIGATS